MSQPFRWLITDRIADNPMADYTIVLTRTVQKQLDKLPDTVISTLLNAIDELASNPRPDGCKKLKGRTGYRIRKGDYRIIYSIEDKHLIVEIIALGHRRNIYE